MKYTITVDVEVHKVGDTYYKIDPNTNIVSKLNDIEGLGLTDDKLDCDRNDELFNFIDKFYDESTYVFRFTNDFLGVSIIGKIRSLMILVNKSSASLVIINPDSGESFDDALITNLIDYFSENSYSIILSYASIGGDDDQ